MPNWRPVAICATGLGSVTARRSSPLSPVGGEMVDQGLITPAGPPVALEDELWFYYTGTRFGHASALARYARGQQAGVKEAE